jgi:hypothetical protein
VHAINVNMESNRQVIVVPVLRDAIVMIGVRGTSHSLD